MTRLLAIVCAAAVTALALAGCGKGPSGPRPFTVGFMPKLVGIPYFQACKRGADEAATELGLRIEHNGPTEADVNAQIDILNQWVAAGTYDCICVACNDPDRIAPVLRRAKAQGILIVTYDADTQEDARHYFVNQATYDAVAREMVDAMAEQLDPRGAGKVGILTSYVQAPNQSQWARRMKAYAAEKYPNMELLPETEHGEDRNLGITKAKALIAATADLKGIIGLTSVAVPAAAEAVRQTKKQGQIKVVGVSTPKDMRDYVLDGTVETFVLWNPIDLGYLTVHVAKLLKDGKMTDNGAVRAGRLGEKTVTAREVLLGRPMRFTKANIDNFDF